jgi:uncharacterized protein involved in copper resistance
MISSTVFAAAIAAAQPQPAPQPAMDHGSMDHSKMDHSKMDMKAAKTGYKMDCCKDGCACCAKDKAKTAK